MERHAAPLTVPQSRWQARLELGFTAGDGRTVLAHRAHQGPLRVQKALYPEGSALCHGIILHPPGGICGGDGLEIAVEVAPGAQALLTTPGAGKWYRSAGDEASQDVSIHVGAGATLEWLPQEGILFDGARARLETRVELAAGARFIGVETLCFGRRASGEKFGRGLLRMATELRLDGAPLWLERGQVAGGSPLLKSAVGLAGFTVSSTVLAAGVAVDADLLAVCRQVVPSEPGALHGVSAMPQLFVGRYLGHSAEAARLWFVDLWCVLRPALVGREAIAPRIWNT